MLVVGLDLSLRFASNSQLSSGSTHPTKTPAFWMGSCHFSPKDEIILPWSCSGYSNTRAAMASMKPEPITGGATVGLAGAEVTEAFWAKLAVLF